MKLHVLALLVLFAAIFAGDAFVLDRDGNGRHEGTIRPPSFEWPGIQCKSTADCPRGQICFHLIGKEWGECH